MEIRSKIEAQIIEDNILRIQKRLDELSPAFMYYDAEIEDLNNELEMWLSRRRKKQNE